MNAHPRRRLPVHVLWAVVSRGSPAPRSAHPADAHACFPMSSPMLFSSLAWRQDIQNHDFWDTSTGPGRIRCNHLFRRARSLLTARGPGTEAYLVLPDGTNCQREVKPFEDQARSIWVHHGSSKIPIEVMAHDRIHRRLTAISLPNK